MSRTIYATFDDVTLAERAVGALLDQGAAADDISLVRRDAAATPPPVATDASSESSVGSSTEPPITPGLEADRVGGSAGTGSSSGVASGATAGAVSGGMGNGMTIYPAGVESPITGPANTGFASFGSTGIPDYADKDQDPARLSGEAHERPKHNLNDPAMATGSGMGDDHNTDTTGSTFANAAREDDGETSMADPETSAKQGISTTTPADAGAGAIKGTGVGLGVGALAALASMFIPGVGLVVGGGALAAALGAMAATAGAGAAAGAVYGYLKDQGMDEPVAKAYDRVVSEGGVLMGVSVPSGNLNEGEVRLILEKYGAAGINAFERSSGGYVA